MRTGPAQQSLADKFGGFLIADDDLRPAFRDAAATTHVVDLAADMLLLLLLLPTSAAVAVPQQNRPAGARARHSLRPSACTSRSKLDSSAPLSVCFELVDPLQSTWNASCSYGPHNRSVERQCRHEEHSQELCGGHGVCFFGRCYCEPGYDGATCGSRGKPPPPCTAFGRGATSHYTGYADACLRHPAYGSAMASKPRWLAAQAAEAYIYTKAFNYQPSFAAHFYAVLWETLFPIGDIFPPSAELGLVIEVGCGAHTWINGLLSIRPDLRPGVISLLDPGIPGYLRAGFSTARCTATPWRCCQSAPSGCRSATRAYTTRCSSSTSSSTRGTPSRRSTTRTGC